LIIIKFLCIFLGQSEEPIEIYSIIVSYYISDEKAGKYSPSREMRGGRRMHPTKEIGPDTVQDVK
jgi:hypothetical protein